MREDEKLELVQNGPRKGWCPRTGKGQRFMGKVAVNGNISDYWVWKQLMS